MYNSKRGSDNFNNSYNKLNLLTIGSQDLSRNIISNNNPYNKLTKLFLVFTLFSVSILSISLISAAEINFIRTENSSDFNQGETLIAKVSGNFIEQPTSNNVFFYRSHVRVPMVY